MSYILICIRLDRLNIFQIKVQVSIIMFNIFLTYTIPQNKVNVVDF